MAKVSPAQFVRQVRQEISRISWANRRETGVATLTVFIMATIAAVFSAGRFGAVKCGSIRSWPWGLRTDEPVFYYVAPVVSGVLKEVGNGEALVCCSCLFRL